MPSTGGKQMAKPNRKSIKNASKRASKPIKRLSRKSTTKPLRKTTKPIKNVAQPKQTFRYQRAEGDPFRPNSSYSVVFSLLHAAGSAGTSRSDLIARVAKVTGKDEKHSAYDCAVLLSARENGERHQSCRSGFWVERINDHLRLHVTAQTTAGK
jgi:hypothetical protein